MAIFNNMPNVAVQIFLAVFFGSIIGMERTKKNRPAGRRTFALVCIGSAIAILTNIFVVKSYAMGDITRIAAKVVSGVGFLGAGMIVLTGKDKVEGLTTAASLWATAALGLSIGAGYYAAAIIGFVVIFFSNTVMHYFDELLMISNVKKVGKEKKIRKTARLNIEISDKKIIFDIFDFLSESGIELLTYKFEKKEKDNYYFYMEIYADNDEMNKMQDKFNGSKINNFWWE
ncbi:MAG: MgtC/SapB family protein [Firmicutes bacterium]|nr:MgtC/SapB family protein [Bacillota bacterium]